MNGMDSLLRKLDVLGGNSKQALKKGIHKAMKHVQGDAKDLAPVAAIDGGQLRNSIKGETEVKSGKIIGKVSTNIYYGPYVEFGTGQRGAASPSPPKSPENVNYRQDWTGMDAQPYLYPALKQNEDNARNIVKEHVKEEIQRVARS
ncbi:HK97-gp10 family putative phage morphogenesis protein [Sporosarcina limicola]|uniref:HK97 gp10 family phage protein n=1 Tax=Sporosarcina limicola TaxID=34101 RepID=A0A927MIZ6_9BACL|nr:HK97-gp10 family putative phage morphogenesis protein [Sporosarcina limicola]MBE1554803.1 HK97 gp10 family phage protein [Sporosarcina limicola]